MRAAERATVLPASWLLSFAALSAAPVLRISDVQALEVTEALALGAAAVWFVYAGGRARFGPAWREYGGHYAVVLCLAAGVSLLSMRLVFYPPPAISLLKQPLVVSLCRLVELGLAMYCTLAAVSAFRRNPNLLARALDVYCGVAAASAFASIAAWIILECGDIRTPFVYGFDDRVRGFFNEGGPYGMFLVSAAVAAFLRHAGSRVAPPGIRRRSLVLPVLLLLYGTALILSGSKAGLLALVLLSGIGVLVSASRRQQFVLLAASMFILIATAGLFEGKFLNYWLLYQNFDEAAAYHPDDPNYVMGRVAGALIVPRMISAHPVSGIGLGNYSLMRNDPSYLQGIPATDEWDLTGMGLLGATAELGAPVALYLFALLLRPLWQARKVRAPVAVGIAAGFQPVSLLLGVNINFLYPWLITAFALGSEPLSQ